MDITESLPFWMKEQKLISYPKLKNSVQCDVCIIGAGIAGIMTAYLLSKEGKKVVLLDDGPIASGQTMRTTAHLTSVLDDRYHNLEHLFGMQGAKIAAESHQAAIFLIASLVKQFNLDCDFEFVDAYLFVDPHTPFDLSKEFASARQAGLDVDFIERCPFSSFDTGQALLFKGQAQFHPIKFINGLCQFIQNLGAEIYCNTHATHIQGNYRIETDQNKHVTASHVVVATNSPINNPFFPHLKQAPYRTYAISGKVPTGSIPKGLYYDTADPYHYVRIFKEDQFDTLIVGGEDHRTAEESHLEKKYHNLEIWARKRFPELEGISNRWSGQVLEPIDSLGFIGRVHKELYIITGDSGNGLTHGVLGAMLINDLIHKRGSAWETIYNPHRISLKALPEFLTENLNTAWQYMDWFKPTEKKTLKPNCGKVIQKGMTKCALYKDAEGNIHTMSAVCPHLKAIVRWNHLENCWECPAHGSRFSALGEVIQGPSNTNLQRLEEEV